MNRFFPPDYTKKCPRCGKEKHASEFSTNYRGTDPLDTYCKQCRRDIYRQTHGGIARALAKFTDDELLSEVRRRGLSLSDA